ncbi:MAG TPA: phytanoyl-CoA dioxygenase family protein [Polyangia bacterium]|nr:phytanoyl-CoA dioxygenase family protein [Polyangia bacterium]
MSAMPELYEKTTFNASGFAIFGKVLDDQQVTAARAELTAMFNQPPDPSWGDSEMVRTHMLARYPKLREMILQPKVMEPLHLLLGDKIALLPDNTATHSRYSGWHKDTHGFERFGYNFHRAPDYVCAVTLIYLQDNDPELGGGLEVVPGSHKEEDRYRHQDNPATHGRSHKLGDPAYPKESFYMVPSHAGDLVVFNDKLDHAGRWPSTIPRPSNLYDAPPPPLPPEKRKFMFAMAAMPDNQYVDQYMDYFNFLKTKFHEFKAMGRIGYSEDVVAQARALGVRLLSHV